MSLPAIHKITPEHERAAIDTLTLAFAADPIARWCWPNPHLYVTNTPDFIRAFAGGAFTSDSAFCTEDFSAAALWLPVGVHPDEAALGEVIEPTVDEATRRDLFGVLEQMGGYHPEEPHWYLPVIGVDPAKQGKGLGAALMKRALAETDRQGLTTYLESSNPRNVLFYERLGFQILGRIQVGSSPVVTPMARRPPVSVAP